MVLEQGGYYVHESFAALAHDLVLANGRGMDLIHYTNEGTAIAARSGKVTTPVIGVSVNFNDQDGAEGLIHSRAVKILIDGGLPSENMAELLVDGVTYGIYHQYTYKPGSRELFSYLYGEV